MGKGAQKNRSAMISQSANVNMNVTSSVNMNMNMNVNVNGNGNGNGGSSNGGSVDDVDGIHEHEDEHELRNRNRNNHHSSISTSISSQNLAQQTTIPNINNKKIKNNTTTTTTTTTTIEKKTKLIKDFDTLLTTGGLDTICDDTWKWEQVIWRNVIIIGLWHLGGLYGCYLSYFTGNNNGSNHGNGGVQWKEYIFHHFIMWYFAALGVTAGAHRLWSHRAYKAKLPLRVFLMLCNCIAFQKTIFDWSRDHRTHHKGSETSSDPHNAKRGFFFAHMGWCFLKKNEMVIKEGNKIDYSDMLADPVVRFQREHYLTLVMIMCYGLPALMGQLIWGSWWNGLFIGGFYRHISVLHSTWCVNSVAHLWGDRPYDKKLNPAENLIVSILSIGEGWHNYHHKYPSDYAASEFGIFRGTWNPTKLFIDFCGVLGLAYDMKSMKNAAKKAREMQGHHHHH